MAAATMSAIADALAGTPFVSGASLSKTSAGGRVPSERIQITGRRACIARVTIAFVPPAPASGIPSQTATSTSHFARMARPAFS